MLVSQVFTAAQLTIWGLRMNERVKEMKEELVDVKTTMEGVGQKLDCLATDVRSLRSMLDPAVKKG